MTTGAAERRIAFAVTAATEGELVMAIAALRDVPRDGLRFVVPALTPAATAARLDALLGADAALLEVEPAWRYLADGHTVAVLVGADPGARGQAVAAVVDALRQGSSGRTRLAELAAAAPTASEVVGWLATSESAAPPGTVALSPLPSVAVGGGRLLVRTPWGSPLLARADDLTATPRLGVHGVYEPGILPSLERLLRSGDAAVDIGANVGLFTLRMAEVVGPSGRVVAVETDPDLHAVLIDNVALARVQAWVTVRDVLDPEVIGPAPVGVAKVDAGGAERRVLDLLDDATRAGRIHRLIVPVVRAVAGREWEPFTARLRVYRDELGASFGVLGADGAITNGDLEAILRHGAHPAVVVDFTGRR
jgi:hypothetical protein